MIEVVRGPLSGESPQLLSWEFTVIGDLLGIAFNLDEEEVGVVLLGDYAHLNTGNEVVRTGRVMDVAVGDSLIGRVVDPLGRVLVMPGLRTVHGRTRRGRGHR